MQVIVSTSKIKNQTIELDDKKFKYIIKKKTQKIKLRLYNNTL